MKNIFLNLIFFVKIYGTNIIKDEYRKIIPEKYLHVIQESYKNILFLTDKSFYIFPFSFFSSSYKNIIEFQNNKNNFYYFEIQLNFHRKKKKMKMDKYEMIYQLKLKYFYMILE
jgi:hypothetical protein